MSEESEFVERNVSKSIKYKNQLEEVRKQLNQWADESQSGGWSTHQVQPQRELAAKIQRLLDR